MKKLAILLVITLALVQLASAVIVDSVSSDLFTPGQEGMIRVEIKNTLSDTVTNVVLSLNFSDLPFIPVGSSSGATDELDENDEETFGFRIRASNEIAPGDYQIPYTLSYTDDDQIRSHTGSIGITVRAQPQISYTINTETPVIGNEGTITLQIVNKGFADARFASVRIFPDGFTLLSEDEVYIGTIDSDDFETATFDVIFSSERSTFSAILEYKDFDNKKIIETVNLPVEVYTREEAIELGIVQRSNAMFYIIIVIAIIVIWFVWRFISKRRRMKKSMEK